MMRRAALESFFDRRWYGRAGWLRLLLPLSWLVCGWARWRRFLYAAGLLKPAALDAAVIVVGNLVVGGSGKTPVVIALANALSAAGLKVGLLCRGYRGRARHWPQAVHADSDPALVGDEAVLLAQRTGLPVTAGADRAAAARALLQSQSCDVLISDDGLQHYRLPRRLEILVVDAQRGFGNGACLPVGPLREPVTRVASVDALVAVNGAVAQASTLAELRPGTPRNLRDPENTRALADFAGEPLRAVAGIAAPERFFARLEAAGLTVERHVFDDHHRYQPGDLPEDSGVPILMTEKDAVKCAGFSPTNCWVVPLEARLDPVFVDWVRKCVSETES